MASEGAVPATTRRPTPMMLLRQRLHPYRSHLKWLRFLGEWQLSRLRFVPVGVRRRAANWINLLVLDEGEEIVWRSPVQGLKFKLNLSCLMQREMYYSGAYQPAVTRILARYFSPDRLFLDLGANIGLHTVPVADRYRRYASERPPMVLAFEPDTRLFQTLFSNVELNHLEPYVSLHNVAVSDRSGRSTFYLAGKDNSGVGSLADQTRTYGQSDQTIEVICVTLDEYFAERNYPRVGLIKADVEGAELLALRGAQRILREHQPVLLLEAYAVNMKPFRYTYADLRSFLVSVGYTIYLIQTDGSLIEEKDGVELTGFDDLLCLPNGPLDVGSERIRLRQ
jgi:FkbM family methyltransferase